MTFIENAVPIKDVAAATKKTVAEVETEAVALAMFVGRDWCGRPAIAEVDAESLVSGNARRALEDAQSWRTHLDTCAAWTADRDEAVSAVQAAHTAASAAQGRFGPDADSRAREAGVEAGRRYESTTPPPTWNGLEDGNAPRMFTERDAKPGGLLDRARDLLAGAPR